MYLILIILNKEEHLDDILQSFVEVGITDATVVDSQSMGKVLAFEVPIFAGLRYQMDGARPYSKMIFAIAEDTESVDYLVKILEDIGIDINRPGIARILTIKLESSYGKPEELDFE